MIDDPDVSIDELMEIVPGPDFPTGGIICGRGRHSPAATTPAAARSSSAPAPRSRSIGKNRQRIVVTEIPYQQARDRIEERIAGLVNDGRIKGISAIRNESDLKEPVRLVLELKRDADPEVVLNQLYQFSPLQDTFSLIFLALVDGKPRVLSIKETAGRVHPAPRDGDPPPHAVPAATGPGSGKHTVEGLLLAHANIDEVIRVIRTSATQAEAKSRLDGHRVPGRDDAAGAGRRGLRRLPAGTRRARSLHADRRAGRRHPADDARPVGQPGAGEARRRVPQAAGRDRRVPAHPLRRARTSWPSSATTSGR